MDSRRLHTHAHQRGKAASKIRDFGISLSQLVRVPSPAFNPMHPEMAYCWRMNQKNEIRTRCEWAHNELSIRYHDEEWGVPQHDDKKLFEFLILEGAQAGLSWDTILRNRLKIGSAVANAKAFLKIQDEYASFDQYAWQFVDGKPRVNSWRSLKHLPARTPESDAMSKDLQKRGFTFVGSTICYAFMQAVGMVNDHVVECFRYSQVEL